MKLSRLVYRNAGLPCLLLAVLVNSAIAGAPGKCADTCTPNCGSASSGVPCNVTVSETSGSNPVATVNRDPICVFSGTKISWSSDPLSDWTVTFGTSHPFPATTHGKFNGKQGHSAGDTASLPNGSPASVCYQYSVEHCINGKKCAQVDPKVIVTNVRKRP
jgi:hypothetical protein